MITLDLSFSKTTFFARSQVLTGHKKKIFNDRLTHISFNNKKEHFKINIKSFQ